MIPEFMRFYSYSSSDVLDELAIRFFSLGNSMYQIQAKESLSHVMEASTAFSGNKEYLKSLEKQQKGVGGIVDEVRTIKGKS